MMFLKIKVSQKHPSYFRNRCFSETYCCNEVMIQFPPPKQYFIFLFVKLWGRHSDRMKMIDYDMRIYGFQAVSYILLIPLFRKIKTDCLLGLVIEICLCHWQIKLLSYMLKTKDYKLNCVWNLRCYVKKMLNIRMFFVI